MSNAEQVDFRDTVYPFMGIEPTNKTQRNQLERYRKHLNITKPEEDFVLKCLLSFDWDRHAILYGVERVQKCKSSLDMISFRVNVKAPSKTIDYVVSNPLREEGWSLKTHEERCWSVWHSLHRYITRK